MNYLEREEIKERMDAIVGLKGVQIGNTIICGTGEKLGYVGQTRTGYERCDNCRDSTGNTDGLVIVYKCRKSRSCGKNSMHLRECQRSPGAVWAERRRGRIMDGLLKLERYLHLSANWGMYAFEIDVVEDTGAHFFKTENESIMVRVNVVPGTMD